MNELDTETAKTEREKRQNEVKERKKERKCVYILVSRFG